jgi:hypothetical protein
VLAYDYCLRDQVLALNVGITIMLSLSSKEPNDIMLSNHSMFNRQYQVASALHDLKEAGLLNGSTAEVDVVLSVISVHPYPCRISQILLSLNEVGILEYYSMSDLFIRLLDGGFIFCLHFIERTKLLNELNFEAFCDAKNRWLLEAPAIQNIWPRLGYHLTQEILDNLFAFSIQAGSYLLAEAYVDQLLDERNVSSIRGYR